jgi:hypothetical protein
MEPSPTQHGNTAVKRKIPPSGTSPKEKRTRDKYKVYSVTHQGTTALHFYILLWIKQMSKAVTAL